MKKTTYYTCQQKDDEEWKFCYQYDQNRIFLRIFIQRKSIWHAIYQVSK